jgi:hypothetical protein
LNSSPYDVALLEVLFKMPAGPPMRSIEDFLTVSMASLGFLSEDIEANVTVITKKEDHPLDWDRLRDANDSYNSILFYPN